MAELPDPYEHFRTTPEASQPPGVYRVVGTADGELTLLRVAGEKGGRRSTGELHRISVSTLIADFEHADNPDAGTSISTVINRMYANLKAAVGLL